MRLRQGITAKSAIEAITQVTTDLGNFHVASASIQTRVQYVDWAETTERRLRGVFDLRDYRDTLYTSRFWHLFNWNGVGGGLPGKPFLMMLGAEKELQLQLLNETLDQLKRLSSWADAHGSRPVGVYDTNALIHYHFPDVIDWRHVMGVPAVHLVVPLIVVDELDRKRYGDTRTAQRARKAQKALWTIVNQADPGMPVPVPNLYGDVTLEVFMDERQHRRLPDPDDEIVARAALMQQLLGSTQRVSVVTGDTGVWLRAKSESLAVAPLPERDSKDLPEPKGEAETSPSQL